LALASGFTIKALVRNPKSISQNHIQLEIFSGDVLNMQDVLKVVDSCDFLVSQIDDEKYIKQMPFVSY